MQLGSQTSLGPYTIVSMIDAGGMGIVYKALDTRLARRVAIKLYGQADRREDARRILDELTRLSSQRYVSPFSLALVHAGLGDTENWRKCMQASLEERSGTLMYLECAALFDSMRSQPFYSELVRKVGLPAAAG